MTSEYGDELYSQRMRLVGLEGILTALDWRKKVEDRGRKFGGWRARRAGGYDSQIPASAHVPSSVR